MQRLNMNIPLKELRDKFYEVMTRLAYIYIALEPHSLSMQNYCVMYMLLTIQADTDAKKTFGYHKLDFSEFTVFFKVLF